MVDSTDSAGDTDASTPRRPFSAELWGVTRHYRGRIAASALLRFASTTAARSASAA